MHEYFERNIHFKRFKQHLYMDEHQRWEKPGYAITLFVFIIFFVANKNPTDASDT